MSPDVAARAFDPFFTTKPVGEGTGLGLAQAYGLARRAGGTARIESRRGAGTTVRLFLPKAEGVAVETPPELRHAQRPLGVAVLIVDDDPHVREALSGLLADLGAAVHTAEDGATALSMLDAIDPDLLLLDFAMPGINGAEVARKAQVKRPEIPVVFVTGFADSDSIERSVGPDALVLRKPFRDFELHSIIAKALQPKYADEKGQVVDLFGGHGRSHRERPPHVQGD
jgi:CheY-like chemotaxis protein